MLRVPHSILAWGSFGGRVALVVVADWGRRISLSLVVCGTLAAFAACKGKTTKVPAEGSGSSGIGGAGSESTTTVASGPGPSTDATPTATIGTTGSTTTGSTTTDSGAGGVSTSGTTVGEAGAGNAAGAAGAPGSAIQDCVDADTEDCCEVLDPVELTSQADVDALAALACEVIAGSLDITGPEITSLEGLETIRTIQGALSVDSTAVLRNLGGLDSLATIEGSLLVQHSVGLTALSGLEALQSVGQTLAIANNLSLADVSALSSAQFAAGITVFVTDNAELVSLDGLDGVDDPIAITIANNAALETLDGLDHMTQVGRREGPERGS